MQRTSRSCFVAPRDDSHRLPLATLRASIVVSSRIRTDINISCTWERERGRKKNETRKKKKRKKATSRKRTCLIFRSRTVIARFLKQYCFLRESNGTIRRLFFFFFFFKRNENALKGRRGCRHCPHRGGGGGRGAVRRTRNWQGRSECARVRAHVARCAA